MSKPIPLLFSCKFCGRQFIPRSAQRIYCTDKCRRADAVKRANTEAGKIFINNKYVWEKTCAWCGRKFLARQDNSRFCSAKCSRAVYNRLRTIKNLTDSDLREMHDRYEDRKSMREVEDEVRENNEKARQAKNIKRDPYEWLNKMNEHLKKNGGIYNVKPK